MQADKKNVVNNTLKRASSAGILTGILVFVVSLIIFYQWHHVREAKQQLIMSDKLEKASRAIQNVFEGVYSSLLSLSLTVYENGKVNGFEEVARQIIASNKNIHMVTLLPGGTTKYIYPLAGNEKLLNYNILTDGTEDIKIGAYNTKESKIMRFAGPFKNFLGDSVVAGRMPVYINDNFWGFSVITFLLKDVIRASDISKIDIDKYSFALSMTDPATKKEIFFYNRTKNSEKKNFKTIDIPRNGWKIYIYSPANARSPFSLLYILLSIILGIIGGKIVANLVKRPEKLRKLIEKQALELADTEMKFKTIFENAPLGLAIIDHSSRRLVEVNKKFSKIAGKSRNYLLSGISLSEFVPSEIYYATLEEFREVLSGNKKELFKEYKHTRGDGSFAWTHVTIAPVPMNNGVSQESLIIVEDITEAKSTQLYVQESERRFKSLFEESPIALWEEDFSGLVSYLEELELLGKPKQYLLDFFNANPEHLLKSLSFVRMLNVNKAVLDMHKVETKKELFDNIDKYIITPKTIEVIKSMLISICGNEKSSVMESQAVTSEGELRDVLLKWHVIPGFGNEYKYVIVASSDITDIKNAQMALENSRLRLETIINTIDGIVWTADPATQRMNFISEKVNELTGYDKDFVLGKKLFTNDSIELYDRASGRAIFKKNVELAIPHSIEYKMYSKSGNPKWFRDSISFIKENEKVQSVLGIMVDITQIKESQAALEDSRARLELIINNLDGVVWTADPTTYQYTFVSKKAKELTEYAPQEWIGRSIFVSESMHFEDSENGLPAFIESIEKGIAYGYEYRMITKSGKTKWFRESIDFIKDAAANIISVIGIMVDITTIKQSEAALQKSFETVSEQNKRLMNFSYIVSHNLRSHSSNIQSLCDLIQQSGDPAEKKELIRYLGDVAQLLNNTMGGLNEVVNIHTTKEIRKENLNLYQYIESTFGILRDKIALKSAIMQNRVDKNVHVLFNSAYLESILLNFISNALKYSSAERKPLVTLDFEMNEEGGVLTIADNGIGIDLSKNGSKIFGLFKTFTHQPESKGVGLYISKNQIEAMGGHVTVESIVNEGTAFKIYFK